MPGSQLLHRRTPADAIQYDGTEEGRGEVAAWVRSRGGSADLRPDGALLVSTPNKGVIVPNHWWVVQGVVGQFFVIEPEVKVRCYDPAEGPNYGATLTRDQAAAIVVAADEMVREASGDQRLAKMAAWIHQLASTTEELR